MPRNRKRRRVRELPGVGFFKPAGIPMKEIGEIVLNVEEFEALRLKDYEGLAQKECAGRMNISQPTFHRLLREAREKVSRAIVTGKAIRIEGGKYILWKNK